MTGTAREEQGTADPQPVVPLRRIVDSGKDIDHRQRTYRTADGALMCLAHGPILSSEARAVASLCGSSGGCRGAWRCFPHADAEPVSKS